MSPEGCWMGQTPRRAVGLCSSDPTGGCHLHPLLLSACHLEWLPSPRPCWRPGSTSTDPTSITHCCDGGCPWPPSWGWLLGTPPPTLSKEGWSL